MKAATMRDIAAASGVSLTTVSRVISGIGYVSEDKRRAVLETAANLGYQSRSVGARAAGGKKLIGIVTKTPFSVNLNSFSIMQTLLTRSAYLQGYGTLSFLLDEVNNKTLLEPVSQAPDYGLSGLAILGFVENRISAELEEMLQRINIPVVFVERAQGCFGFNRVLVDNVRGLYLATRHLIERGHRKLLYVTLEPLGGGVEEDRIHGYQLAIKEAPQGYLEGLTAYVSPSKSGDYNELGYKVLEKMMAKHPDITGIVNWADSLAAGELQYLTKHGIRVPEDVEVIGYDDIFAPLLAPPLSSVRMPYAEITEAAIRLLTEQQDSPDFIARSVKLVPKLVLR